MPVIKRREERDALRKPQPPAHPATFFRPGFRAHPVAPQAHTVLRAGLFNVPGAIESYSQVFAEENALDKLEAFASLNRPKHYALPVNSETITLNARPGPRLRDQDRRPEDRALYIAAARPSSGKSSPVDRTDKTDPALGQESIAELTAKMLLEVEAVRFYSRQAVHLHLGLASPVYRLPPADLLSPRAPDPDGFRRLDHRARCRLRSLRRGCRRRETAGHRVRGLDGG